MPTAVDALPETPPVPKSKKANSSHLKVVPETRELRDQIRERAFDYARTLDRSRPLTREDSRRYAEDLLGQLGLGEQYLGFTLVAIANEFWRDQVASIPFHRRLLLLPHCLKNAEGCPADYDEFGLDCKKCGACSVADFKVKAEELGYKVLVSEGTPIVLKIIVSGHVDAIVGVACLNVLEKAFDKILLSGIPCVATPLLSSNCKSTSVDDDWVFKMIELKTEPVAAPTKSYVHLMRAANQIFDTAELDRLAPRSRIANPKSGYSDQDPLVLHESIAYDFLARGGKRSRPLITLATYDALTGGKARLSEEGLNLSDSVLRTALAIETFHKASLVHDDIEDDDAYRYGAPTLHREHGIGTAINIGDYLIGLGYRLVSRERRTLGGDCTADILDKLADAHLKLSEGQGAELLWREAREKKLTPLDALKIYALKTAPAFEAALYAGARLVGPADDREKLIADFSRNLGVAFQILNDMKDWSSDSNKVIAGQDLLGARPTLLLALALEALAPNEKAELLETIASFRERNSAADTQGIARVRTLYEKAKVFTKADALVEKYRARAEALADEVEPPEFRELLYYLVDTVLERQPVPDEEAKTFLVQLGQ